MTDECKLGGGDTGEEGGCLQAVVCRLDGARERKIGRTDRKGREGGRWRGVVCGFGSSVAASLVLPGHACVRRKGRWRSQRRRAGGSSIIAVLWRVQSVDVLSAATRAASTMAGINGLIFRATKAVGFLLGGE